MSVSTATPVARKSYNPNAIRRCVRRVESSPEIVSFETKSFTRADVKHEAHVDITTGEIRCSCEDFKYRKAPLVNKIDDARFVSIATPLLWCKHAERAVKNCVRRGEVLFDRATKTYSLVTPIVHAVAECPPHINPETGELKAGYLPNGQVDYCALFD